MSTGPMNDVIVASNPAQYSVKEIAASMAAMAAYEALYAKHQLKDPYVYKRIGLQGGSAFLADKGVDVVNKTLYEGKLDVEKRVMYLPASCGLMFAAGAKVAGVQSPGQYPMLWDFLLGAGSCAAPSIVLRQTGMSQ